MSLGNSHFSKSHRTITTRPSTVSPIGQFSFAIAAHAKLHEHTRSSKLSQGCDSRIDSGIDTAGEGTVEAHYGQDTAGRGDSGSGG